MTKNELPVEILISKLLRLLIFRQSLITFLLSYSAQSALDFVFGLRSGRDSSAYIPIGVLTKSRLLVPDAVYRLHPCKRTSCI